jgi:hypothetical protein
MKKKLDISPKILIYIAKHPEIYPYASALARHDILEMYYMEKRHNDDTPKSISDNLVNFFKVETNHIYALADKVIKYDLALETDNLKDPSKATGGLNFEDILRK